MVSKFEADDATRRKGQPVTPDESNDHATAVIKAWTNNGPYASVSHVKRVEAVRKAFPGLARGLDNLVARKDAAAYE